MVQCKCNASPQEIRNLSLADFIFQEQQVHECILHTVYIYLLTG